MGNRFLYLVRHGEAVDEADLSEAGRHQATLLGERLRDVPFAAIHHSPLPRAVQTTELIAEHLPGVPTYPSDRLGDYIPFAPDTDGLPPPFGRLVDSYTAAERAEGSALAVAAIERHTATTEEDTRELIVTHNFLIGWFVRHALDAPDWRWLGLNQCNGALTVILYRPERPPALVTFNDTGHLPPSLRWTGFPPDLRV